MIWVGLVCLLGMAVSVIFGAFAALTWAYDGDWRKAWEVLTK